MNEPVHSRRPVVRAKTSAAKEPTRTNDPERTMANIMEVAMAEFAEKGLAGARIDEIAAATKTSKRMIYYYFESKEGLYLAALEESYRRMREIESQQHLEDLEPVAALRRLVEFTFDHHYRNPDFIRLVMIENIHQYAKDNSIYSVRADTNFDNHAMLKIFNDLGYSYCGEVYFRGSARRAFEKVLLNA